MTLPENIPLIPAKARTQSFREARCLDWHA